MSNIRENSQVSAQVHRTFVSTCQKMNQLTFMLSVRLSNCHGNQGLTYLDQISKYLSTDKTVRFLAEDIAIYAKDKQLCVTSCIYFHCFSAIQFCSASVFMKSCERCLILLCIRSFDVSRMFAARYDVVR